MDIYEEKLNEEDPYILPKLAFLHLSKTFVKQLLKGNVIHANEKRRISVFIVFLMGCTPQ